MNLGTKWPASEKSYAPAPVGPVCGCAAGWPVRRSTAQRPRLSLHCTTAPTPEAPSPNHTHTH